jgi:hypothetical protein
MSDLPKVPDEYVELALQTAKQKVKEFVPVVHDAPFKLKEFQNLNDPMMTENGQLQNPLFDRIITHNGKQSASLRLMRFGLEKEMSEWVNNNITTEWSQVGVGTTVHSGALGDTEEYMQGPHTDVTRQYTLIYVLERSNEDQYTVFYQEPGYPVRRKKNTLILDMDHLVEIDSICIPLHTWVLVDSTIIHSAQNVRGGRISIQIGMDSDTFNVFAKEE